MMRFRKDNRIRYGQDDRQHVGIPSGGVDFSVEGLSEVWVLSACGYGCLAPTHSHSCYGDGALFVWGLTTQQRKRFEAAEAES